MRYIKMRIDLQESDKIIQLLYKLKEDAEETSRARYPRRIYYQNKNIILIENNKDLFHCEYLKYSKMWAYTTDYTNPYLGFSTKDMAFLKKREAKNGHPMKFQKTFDSPEKLVLFIKLMQKDNEKRRTT